jgi:hypothetical protein
MDEINNIIYAKDAKEGQYYLLVISPSSVYKLLVEKINRTLDRQDKESVSSVSVNDERYQNSHTISGDTYLLEYDETFYLESLKKRKTYKEEKENNSIDTKKEIIIKTQGDKKQMAQNKNPRSKIIDKYLASLAAGNQPDWSAVVKEVVGAGCATAEEEKKIIFQAKMRWKWYSVDGKTNPASIKENV